MKWLALLLPVIITLTAVAHAAPDSSQPSALDSITIEGGPVASKHFQSGAEHFRERHGLAVLQVSTRDYGNWGFYFLNPNSVDKTSFGIGYVTDPYTLPMGPLKLELTGALGLVTGYQDYPVPLLAGEARLVIYEHGPWDTGLAAAAMPYFMKDDAHDRNEFGVVATTPFLSIRYRFD
jgi:hypothetical protein